LRRLLAFGAFAPILLAFGALAPIDQLTVALRAALLQRVLAQYRCDRMRAMPHNVATAYTRAFCTTGVRKSGSGFMKVLPWSTPGSRARYEHEVIVDLDLSGREAQRCNPDRDPTRDRG
jgi:hypothetical protein